MPERLFGRHRWRNAALAIMALALINMTLVAAGLKLNQDLNDARDDAREANQRLDAIAGAERLTEAAACFSQASDRPATQGLVNLFDLVISDIRKTTEDAIKNIPEMEANKLRRQRLARIAPAEVAIRRLQKRAAAIKSADMCAAEARRAGLSEVQINRLREAARAEDPR